MVPKSKSRVWFYTAKLIIESYSASDAVQLAGRCISAGRIGERLGLNNLSRGSSGEKGVVGAISMVDDEQRGWT